MTGRMRSASNYSADAKSLWAEVKENRRKIRGCPRHRFEAMKIVLGQRIQCQNCNGMMGLIPIGEYIAGYKAAGGDTNDIWPGFEGRFDGIKDQAIAEKIDALG